ncbi:MAG: DUF1501 domain-containing protein [Cytophagales bacterium]|nr:DUF1501 domain-containing protein [Cytophagales bacterium]
MAHLAAMPAFIPGMDMFAQNELMSNTVADGKILVILRLDGGNDGLNMVIPLDQYSNLQQVRPNVILPENKILPIKGTATGLHPAMAGLNNLIDEKRLAILQSVGYSNPNYSHFRSSDIWMSGSDADKNLSSGWMARYLESQHPNYPMAYPNANFPHPLSIEISWQSTLLFQGQNSFTSLIYNNPDNFYKLINPFVNSYPQTLQGSRLAYLQLIGRQSQLYGSVVQSAYRSGNTPFPFEENELGNQFKIIQKLISGGLNTRVYMIRLGGFDTHNQQVDSADHTKGQHMLLLKQINDGIVTFMKNLDAQNLGDRVVGVTLSEFGRTIHSNGSGGTDHGTVAPMLVFGNAVRGGVIGTNPVIPKNYKMNDDLAVQFDYRQAYSSLLNQWMDSPTPITNQILYREFDKIKLIKETFEDSDSDGVPDLFDKCSNTPLGTLVDINGCPIFSMSVDNYSIKLTSPTCPGTNNGAIQISFKDTQYTYLINIMGPSGFNKSIKAVAGAKQTLENLINGNYNFEISIDGKKDYLQLFDIQVKQPNPLIVQAILSPDNNYLRLDLLGSDSYYVQVNNKTIEVKEVNWSVGLVKGNNKIRVWTSQECQGEFNREIFVSEQIQCFPNPCFRSLTVYVAGQDSEVEINLFDLNGNQLEHAIHFLNSMRMVSMNLENYASGTYILEAIGRTVNQRIKLLKL